MNGPCTNCGEHFEPEAAPPHGGTVRYWTGDWREMCSRCAHTPPGTTDTTEGVPVAPRPDEAALRTDRRRS